MNKYDLIDTFFSNQSDYINFLVSKQERIIANNSGTCFAKLKKEKDCWVYTLTYNKDGKYIGEYINPFRANLENIDKFNIGGKIFAEWLELYIDSNDATQVPEGLPAFGDITFIK